MNPVYSCNVASYKNFMPLTFDGTESSLCKILFSPGDFTALQWNGCILAQKTQATQSVDNACIFRVMSGNSRLTLTIRTSGAVCLRLYKAGGSVQRECQTTSIPTTGNVMHIGYSWDGNRLALSVYDTTAKTLVQVVESTTNISSLPAWSEADGVYVGNRADGTLPYKGNIYGGTFGYRTALSGASMAREAASGNMSFGTNFVIHPQVMGYRGTGLIREPNHHDITVMNTDKTAFWNLNVSSSVLQEWWRFYASVSDIPPGMLVLDADGVVKQCLLASGTTWVTRVNAADNSWFSICLHTPTGRLVAVGNSGTGNRVMTSDDGGITWTTRASAADNNWRSICLHTPTGRLVAVADSGAGNRVMTSDDGGITWTTRASAADNSWVSICLHTPTGRLVAVGYSGTGNRVMTSDDGGITWTTRASAVDNNWFSICLHTPTGRLVAVGNLGTGNRVMTSDETEKVLVSI